jgi:hypothetical protein
MGRYDISGILMAVAERKAQERARNQALDIEREKMGNEKEFQGKQLEIQKQSADTQALTAKSQANYFETQRDNLLNEIKEKNEANPMIDVAQFQKENPGLNIMSLAGKDGKARYSALHGMALMQNTLKASAEQIALNALQKRIALKSLDSEDMKNTMLKAQFDQTMASLDAETRAWDVIQPPIKDAQGNVTGRGNALDINYGKIRSMYGKVSGAEKIIAATTGIGKELVGGIGAGSVATSAAIAVKQYSGAKEVVRLESQKVIDSFNGLYKEAIGELSKKRPIPMAVSVSLPSVAAEAMRLLEEPGVQYDTKTRNQLNKVLETLNTFKVQMSMADQERLNEVLLKKGTVVPQG